MRLIDGDALRDKLQSFAYDDWNQGIITFWAEACNEIADMVADMPTIEPDEDTVSRQAVIDAINGLHDKPNAWLDYAVDEVKALPSSRQCLKHKPDISMTHKEIK